MAMRDLFSEDLQMNAQLYTESQLQITTPWTFLKLAMLLLLGVTGACLMIYNILRKQIIQIKQFMLSNKGNRTDG